MSVPTPFETTGDWTSLTEEESFLQSLDGVGGLTIGVAGQSVQDRPIWVATIGAGTSTVVIGSAQHATEPATRESSFGLLRDLAYRTESWMDPYLASHRVVVIPTINPDGFAASPRTRNNANDVNLNRDHFELTQPEALAVQQVIADTDPDVVMDAHETSGQPVGDWRPYPAGYPGEYPGLRALATEFVDQTTPIFTAQGWSTVWYPYNILPYGGMSTSVSAQGRVSILSETVSVEVTAQQRVEISLQTYRQLLQWHRDNRAAIIQARADAAAYMSLPQSSTVYPGRQYIGSAAVSRTSAVGYMVADLPQLHQDLFGITMTGDRVSLAQPARLMIAALCEPDSYVRVASASPIYESNRAGTGLGSVDFGGVRHQIGQAYVMVGGVRRKVRAAYVMRDGVRQKIGG